MTSSAQRELAPKLAAEALGGLAHDPNPAIRAAVARHPNAPAYVLERLATEFPAEVLANPAWPLLRLAQPGLLQHWSTPALLGLLRQPDVPLWVRQQAQKAKAVEVQVALANHPALTPQEMAQLAQHPAWLVRARIAARPDLAPELLERFTQDQAYGVRLALAYRHDLSELAEQVLERDPSRLVQQVFRQSRSVG